MQPSRLLFIDLKSTSLSPDERDLLASRRFGGMCLFGYNIVDRYQLADYVAEVRSLAGDDFVVAIDQEGGGVLRLFDVPYPPPAMALGTANDLRLTREVAAACARGLRSVSINLNFAPVADVNVNPLNPVIADRSFGSDPHLVAQHVAAFVNGLQSEGVAATAKHFPGHGDVDVDSHLALPVLNRSLEELEALELPPFHAAVQANAAAIMTAHILFPTIDAGMPATLSRTLIRRLLREKLGYEGVVISDALDMKAITDHHAPPQANVLALLAGVDVPLNIGTVKHHLANADGVDHALAEGRLDPTEVQRSLERLASLAGSYPASRPEPDRAFSPGDDELLDEAARRGLVRIGEIPQLQPGASLTVVTASGVWRNSAEQERVSPGPDLIDELRHQGFSVNPVVFEPEKLVDVTYADQLAQRVTSLVNTGQPGGLLVYASSRRTPLTEAEVAFAEQVAAIKPGRFLHAALWNPYHAELLPKPALISFGFRPASLRAVVKALAGA